MPLHDWFGLGRRGHLGVGSMGGRSPGRRSLRPGVESVEERTMPAVSPLLARAAGVATSPTARATAVSASDAAAWVDSVGRIILRTSLPAEFVTRTAAEIVRGLPLQDAATRILQEPSARVGVSQLAFQFLLGRDVNPSPPVPLARSFVGQGNLRVALIQVAASKELWQKSRNSAGAYREALAGILLDQDRLPGRFAGRPVATLSQRLALTRALARSARFQDVWTDRLAQMALPGTLYPASVLQSARRVIGRPDGLNRALAIFLGHPLSVEDVLRRGRPASAQPVSVGTVADQSAVVNRQGLVPDPVTDPPAFHDVSLISGTQGVPQASPWGKTAILPQVPYAAIMAGDAAQPTLAFSAPLGSGAVASQTIQLWFQAKSSGALLSETVRIGGSPVQVPLIYIQPSGKLAAGLFDQTPLSIVPDQTVFLWQDEDDTSLTKQPSLGAAGPVVSQRTVVDNTWHHVALVIEGGSQALYLDGVLQGRVTPAVGSSYSYAPVLSSGAVDMSKVTFQVGGTIIPQDRLTPYPQIHYPQGLIGSIDEVATWSTALTQEQVQAAMTSPVSSDAGLRAGLVNYFNFDQPASDSAWTNQAPGQTGSLTGPTSGTLAAQTSTTIPTDPFADPSITRLPGGRAWGLRLMTPLASPSVSLAPRAVAAYKAGLSAGDQLQIGIPDGNPGTLFISVADDVGDQETASIVGGQETAVRAMRTGTYMITLLWQPADQGTESVDVQFGLISGSLNSLIELATSYKRVDQATQDVEYRWAYADPTLPGVNPAAGSDAGDRAPAGYWPLWNDTRFFPVPSGTDANAWANALSVAYAALVARSPSLSGGYANLIDAGISEPTTIQMVLAGAYQSVLSSPGQDPPSTAALQAVYDFFTAANRIRSTVYAVFTGQGDATNPTNLVGWTQAVLNVINASSGVPAGIAKTIADGQAKQVTEIPVSFPNSANPTSAQIIGEAAVWAAGGALGAFFGDSMGINRPILGAILGGAGASVLGSFIGEAGSPDNIGITVPVGAITTNIVTAQNLSDLAANINDAMREQWTNINALVSGTPFIQTVMSNYGLLAALGEISGDPLAREEVSPSEVATDVLSRASWRTMIPAVFDWKPVSPTGLPSGNGQTTNLQGAEIAQYNGSGPEDLATADFNQDGELDLVVANNGSDDLTMLQGNGDGTFQAGVKISLDGPDGARGLAVGDFNGDGIPDLAASNYSSNNLSILIGPFSADSGRFSSVTTQKISGRGPIRMAVGDFGGQGNQDLVVANFKTDDLTLLTGFDRASNQFEQVQTVSLADRSFSRRGPDGASDIAAGDFDRDGFVDLAVSDYSSSVLSLLWGQSGGGFGPATTVSLKGGIHPQGIVASDLDGDGNLDLAVANTRSGDVRILYGSGGRSFSTPQVLPLADDTSPFSIYAQTAPGNPFPTLVVSYVTSDPQYPTAQTQGMIAFYSQGPRQFAPGIYYLGGGAPIFPGLTGGDFDGDGLAEFVVPGNDSSKLTLFRPADAGNFATFLPSTSDPATLLAQVAKLQGGNTVYVGPYNLTGQVTPRSNFIPPYLADVSLPFLPGQAPLSAGSPGYFFSVTPAGLAQSSYGLSFQDPSAMIGTAWNLFDANGNPIAPGTLRQLFGAPVADASAGPNATRGVSLAPTDPQRPFAAINGGWYYDTVGAPDGFGTWADAFFNWGLADSSYSPRTLVPYLDPGTGSGALDGTLTSGSSVFGFYDIKYTVTYTPAYQPPAGRGVQVDLTSSFNRTGIVSNGTVLPNNGGLDGGGNAYSAEFLGGPISWGDLLFRAGPANRPNAIAAQGQTIALPAGRFSKVSLVATGVAGDQADQSFIVTFADGSTYTDTFTLPDWANTNVNPSTIASTMPYRNILGNGSAGGSFDGGPFNLYGFTLDYRSPKTVNSIILPNNPDVLILGITLS